MKKCHAYDRAGDDIPWWWLAWMLGVVLFDEARARVTRRFRPMRANQFREEQAVFLDQPEVMR